MWRSTVPSQPKMGRSRPDSSWGAVRSERQNMEWFTPLGSRATLEEQGASRRLSRGEAAKITSAATASSLSRSSRQAGQNRSQS